MAVTISLEIVLPVENQERRSLHPCQGGTHGIQSGDLRLHDQIVPTSR